MNSMLLNFHDALSDTSTEPENLENFHPNLKNSHNFSNSKHKRSLCRNFTENGFCPYGQKCQFAHGLDELKCNETQNNLYKTKVCYSFLKKGFCMYELRCNFIHSNADGELETMKSKAKELYRDIFLEGKKRDESSLIKLLKNSK